MVVTHGTIEKKARETHGRPWGPMGTPSGASGARGRPWVPATESFICCSGIKYKIQYFRVSYYYYFACKLTKNRKINVRMNQAGTRNPVVKPRSNSDSRGKTTRFRGTSARS